MPAIPVRAPQPRLSGRSAPVLIALLAQVGAAAWRGHPWRQALALLAVALGVALAFSVHLINVSALSEFSAAVRAANGEPDMTLRCADRGGCDDRLLDAVAALPGVHTASPVLEIDSFALPAAGGARVPLQLLGIDMLSLGTLAPQLMPRPAEGQPRTAALDPDRVFLNPAALQRLGLRVGDTVAIQQGLALRRLPVAGTVAAGGGALAVIDIAGAQQHFDRLGRLSRIDLRLQPGADAAALVPPAGLQRVRPDDAQQRVSNVSRAYRVNLTVLALVALFVGAFLVFSVIALSVAQRTPEFALLGVLGLSARERQQLVLAECTLIGLAGSALGIAGGTGLAALALRWLAGDLGSGYFPGIAPVLAFSWPAAGLFAALGVAAALAAGWLPARQAAALAPALALKGLGGTAAGRTPGWLGPALIAAGAALALLPPVQGLPLGAYASVAALLLGGIATVPAVVAGLLARWQGGDAPLLVLALARARHERQAATVAVAGVVASLSLAVALTVMVASFRDGVSRWLDQVLPADLYARTAIGAASSDSAFLPPEVVAAAARVPGVARLEASRVRALALDPVRPSPTLVARPLADPAAVLPLLGPALPAGPGAIGVYVSEAMAALHGATPGRTLALPIGPGGTPVATRVLGVWRDYARQFGTVAIDLEAYRAVSGDRRLNDLALWLAPGASVADVMAGIRALAAEPGLIEFAQTAQLRAASLAIFDRSFAVTYYLQAVAVGIGLFGIAASFSAQVLARRREFALLAHLGLTRGQIIAVVTGEGAAWTAAGALLGLALGLAVSVVLVHVVNPQSFHWTMELLLPWGRLAALCAAVGLAGSVTAALSARAAASRDIVRAAREDW